MEVTHFIFVLKFIGKFLIFNNSDFAIKLKKDKQLFYSLIYILKLIKIEILKAYIKINLANDFIWPFKSLIIILILFN